MAQRKQSFRFRIPWLSGPTESFSLRQKDRQKYPTQSDTNIPIQRPSKPSVITPSELSPPSPTKTEETSRAEPQKQSPPHPTHPPSSSVSIESPVTTQPKTPSPLPPLQPSSHADSPSPVHIASSSPKTQPQSPSHLASDNGAMKVPKPAAEETTHPASSSSEQEKEKMVLSEPKPQEAELKVKSPLRTTPTSPETSFQPERMSTQPADSEQQVSSLPSSSPVSKTEPATHPHPSSPLASERISEELKPNTEETTPQELKEKMAVTVPQETEPKIKSPLKTIPKSPETSSQPENVSIQPTAIVGYEQRSTTPKAPLETQTKSLQPEEEEKVVHETTKEGKGKDTTTGQPSRRTIASASGTTTTKAKDSFAKVFRADKKQHGAPRETVERKIMFATSNLIGKDTRVVSSTDEGTRNVSSISHEKTVSSSGEKAPLQKGIKDDITKFVHKLAASVHPTQPVDDKQFSVVTLAGDNKGATMHVGSESAKKEGSIHIHRAYKSDPEESTEVTTDGEENTKEDMEEDEVGMAYVNSNIQSINNSLMFHGSITERDPGVQLTLPQKPVEPIKPALETQRTRFNINRAEKLTYQPTVRRRYPRGLFLEPNDPDPDNSDKPRRHGCKFSCDKAIEDIEIL